ncbi:MAG TPA: CHAT domain-containing protein, partial [Deltaproteobacteria bacterium]|nr:CHAT domain-containing protein [Deltaproteobacteria bacterium]
MVVLPNGGGLLRQPKPIVSETPVVIAGDPEFGGELVPLAGARKAAERLGELYQVTPLLGRQATEAALRQRLGRGVRILHLVTHGEFSSRDPLDSTIFLSRGERAYALTARAIFEQPLPAQFVVRSGCETGMGKRVSGEDLLGLT